MRIGQQRKRAREVGQGGRKGWKFFNVFFLFSSPRELSTLVPPGQPRAPLLYTKIMRNFLSFSAFSFKNLIFFPSLLLGCLEFFQHFFSSLPPRPFVCTLLLGESVHSLTGCVSNSPRRGKKLTLVVVDCCVFYFSSIRRCCSVLFCINPPFSLR